MPQEAPKPGLLNHLWYALGRLAQKVSGWQVPGKLPEEPKYIIIAQHSSGWDLVAALMGMAVLSHGYTGLHFRWMMKKEMFPGPLGWFFRALGGIPIARSERQDIVRRMADEFAAHERMALIITPEATRKRGRHWRTGFYYIALAAQVPILCGRLDYSEKVVGPGLLLYPSGDINQDMCAIKRFYQGMTPLHPEQVGEITIEGLDDCDALDPPAQPRLKAQLTQTH